MFPTARIPMVIPSNIPPMIFRLLYSSPRRDLPRESPAHHSNTILSHSQTLLCVPKCPKTLTLPASCPRALMDTLTTWELVHLLLSFASLGVVYKNELSVLLLGPPSDQGYSGCVSCLLHLATRLLQRHILRPSLFLRMQVFTWAITLLSVAGVLVLAAPTHVRPFIIIFVDSRLGSLIHSVYLIALLRYREISLWCSELGSTWSGNWLIHHRCVLLSLFYVFYSLFIQRPTSRNTLHISFPSQPSLNRFFWFLTLLTDLDVLSIAYHPPDYWQP